MVGGPTKGTRFRPLSLTVAKPLFPICGVPLVAHPVLACRKIPNLLQVVLVGFYPAEEMRAGLDTASLSKELGVPVTYVQEKGAGHGSAGGLHHFRSLLLEGNPEYLFVLNCDVCSDYPLEALLSHHRAGGGVGTVLVKDVAADIAMDHGEVVYDRTEASPGDGGVGGLVLHYAEKPETHVSSTVNCGVYVFTASALFPAIEAAASGPTRSGPSLGGPRLPLEDGGSVGMPDVLTHLTERKQLVAFEGSGFWEVLKAPGVTLKFSALYLSQMGSDLALARARLKGGPEIVGDVYIHPDADVHESARIGPNVAIESGARIGPGVRLAHCILLDRVQVQRNACVFHAIIGWGSRIGPWARVQGTDDDKHKHGVAILAENVAVGPEVVVVSSIILPHKELKASVRNEIVL